MPAISLRGRVLAGIGCIAVVLAGVLVFITRTTESNLLDQVDVQLASAGDSVRETGFDRPRGPDGGAGFDDDPDVDVQVPRLSSFYVAVVDEGAIRTLTIPNLRGGDNGDEIPALTVAQVEAAARTGQPFTVDAGDSGLRYRARATVDHGAVTVVALPLDSVDAAVSDLTAVAIGGGLVILAALGLVAWWVIHLGVRPVKRMTGVATAIAAGDLSHRVDDARPGTEAGDLGVALNAMLGRIETAFDERTQAENRLRQFVADASHELRTPVATIRGYAELYRAGALGSTENLDDAMRRTEQEAIRMGGLVDDLLHLARLDQGRPLAAEPVDLAAIVRDAASDAHAMAPDRPVEVHAPGPVVVSGDEARLRQVVANVVGNALVHTPVDATIELHARREGDLAVVEITDHGPGMTEEVAARAFERFYRADPSRSRHHGGSGLGLAIVDATVGAHGGAVVLRTAPGEGTTVRLELPVDGDGGPEPRFPDTAAPALG